MTTTHSQDTTTPSLPASALRACPGPQGVELHSEVRGTADPVPGPVLVPPLRSCPDPRSGEPSVTETQTLVFTGPTEADLLIEAGCYLRAHPDVVVIATSWHGDYQCPHGSEPDPHRSTYAFAVIVDRALE